MAATMPLANLSLVQPESYEDDKIAPCNEPLLSNNAKRRSDDSDRESQIEAWGESGRRIGSSGISKYNRSTRWLCLFSGLALGTVSAVLVGIHIYNRPSYICHKAYETRGDYNSRPWTVPVALKSADPEFDIHLSYQPSVCNSFKVTVKRNNPEQCRLAEARAPVSADPVIDKYVTEQVGPDGIVGRTDGSQRYVVNTPQYEGNCTYALFFPIQNGGRLWLDLQLYYKNYDAFWEGRDLENITQVSANWTWPLLPEPLALDLCSSHCTRYTGHQYFNRLESDYQPELQLNENTDDLAHHLQLPSCNGTSPIRGIYVPASFEDIINPQRAIPLGEGGWGNKPRLTAGFYQFVPTGCRWRHAGLSTSAHKHQNCTAVSRQALLVGDSHTRAFFVSLRNRLTDVPGWENPKMPHMDITIDKLHLEFDWDPYFEKADRWDCSKLANFTHIAFSVGAWQQLHCHASQKFLPWVERTMQNLNNLAATCERNIQFTWILPPIKYPMRNWPDCRTPPRVEYWARAIEHSAYASGWSVIDLPHLTGPISPDLRYTDGQHYMATDAWDPATDELIDKMGLCA